VQGSPSLHTASASGGDEPLSEDGQVDVADPRDRRTGRATPAQVDGLELDAVLDAMVDLASEQVVGAVVEVGQAYGSAARVGVVAKGFVVHHFSVAGDQHLTAGHSIGGDAFLYDRIDPIQATGLQPHEGGRTAAKPHLRQGKSMPKRLGL